MNESGFSERPLEIDVTNEVAFKTGVVQALQMIHDNTACLPSLKKKVDTHEQIYKFGKWILPPALAIVPHVAKGIWVKIFGA